MKRYILCELLSVNKGKLSEGLKKNKGRKNRSLTYKTRQEALGAAKQFEAWIILDLEDNIICDASDRKSLGKIKNVPNI